MTAYDGASATAPMQTPVIRVPMMSARRTPMRSASQPAKMSVGA